MSLSVYATGLAGIQRGMQGLQRVAQDVADSAGNGFDTASIAESLVYAKQHQKSIEASARTIEMADRTMGHLIDILV